MSYVATETIWDGATSSKRVCCNNCKYSIKHIIIKRGKTGCDYNRGGECLNSGLELKRLFVKNIGFINNGPYKYSNFEPYFEEDIDMFSDKDFEL